MIDEQETRKRVEARELQEVKEIEEEIDRLQTRLKAIKRIESFNLLVPYREALMNAGAEWVAYAPLNDIYDWCKTIKKRS